MLLSSEVAFSDNVVFGTELFPELSCGREGCCERGCSMSISLLKGGGFDAFSASPVLDG